MYTLWEIIFILSCILLLHSYIFYPVSLWLLNNLIKKKYIFNSAQPSISIIISAFNEEKVIERTIRNLMKSNYNLNKLEIMVGSDNSTDATNQILENLKNEFTNLKNHFFFERKGKPNVLNNLVSKSTGEILVFCDANTLYDKNAIKNMAKYYNDPKIGGVSGKLRLLDFEISLKSGSQEKKYWDVETWLKVQEGKIGMLIGANGGIYSIRRELFKTIPTDSPVMDDFYISLKVLEQKKDFIFVNESYADEFVAPTIRAEFNRKIRNNSINLATIRYIKKLLSPSFGLIAYGIWSHKIIRWFTPVLLILLFLSNVFLINTNNIYLYFLLVQIIFYLMGLGGFLLKRVKIYFTPFLLCFYFIITSVAMLIGLFKFFFNKQTPFWESTARE